MLVHLFALDYYVINIGLNIFFNQISEYFVDEYLICCPCILQTKRHDHVTIYMVESAMKDVFYWFSSV